MDFKEASKQSSSEVIKQLATSTEGLQDNEVIARRQKYGENKIAIRETTPWQIFLRQFKSPFVYLLFVSFIISFVLGERLDAFMILLFVGINTVLGFYQEYKSESAVKLLKKYLIATIKVRRGNEPANIEIQDLVPGDILILEPGDILPADVRFIESLNLTLDESVLTGESQPVHKYAEEAKENAKDIYTAGNIGFSGTTVVGGKAEAVVIATAADTVYAKIVELTSESERESSFEKELSRFSKFTLGVVLATLIFVVVTSVAVKPDPSLIELALFAIALSVSVIPEALPVVTTFSLSIGAVSLAKKSVVVKRLSAIEDLGALEVLCSDKTGTLTENKLTVDEIIAEDQKDCVLKANLAAGDPSLSRNMQNNAFDLAINAKLDKDSAKQLKNFKLISEIPFDPQRRRVTIVYGYKGNNLLVTRGAPEDVLSICCITDKEKKRLLKKVKTLGLAGKRVLAVAEKELKNLPAQAGLSAQAGETTGELKDLEKDLRFLGLVAFSAPVKKSAYKAIDSAIKLGVEVKIITGDAPEVAGSVAKEIGLIEDVTQVLTGADFLSLSISEKHEAVKKYKVFARVNPTQKYDLIKLLQEKYSVGFLGEGINDAPALKIANVAIVVAGAADVAREAADIVLLQRDLKVVLEGIEGGRKVFENTSKYIAATMASNFGNFFAVAIIAPFISFLPMLPLQILLVNLLSDFPMIMVATDNVDKDSLAAPKRYNLKSFVSTAFTFGFISTAFDFVLFNSFVHRGEAQLQTYWFIESILSELLFLFTIRSKKLFFKASAPSKSLIYLTVLTIIITLIIPFTALGDRIFGFIRPSIGGLLLVFAIVIVYLGVNEAAKYLLNKRSFLNT